LKTSLIFLALLVNTVFAQTKSIIFPQLLSITNSVLMTNAEFRDVSGTRIIFLANDVYQSFEASNLNESVLSRLGLTVSQLKSNKDAAKTKQQAAQVAQAAYQKSLAALAGTNREIQILSVNADYGAMKCTALADGAKREILIKNLPFSVQEFLNKYNQLKADIGRAEILLEEYTRKAERADAVAPKGAEANRVYTGSGNIVYDQADTSERRTANLMLQQAKEDRIDVNKLHELLADWTNNDLTNRTMIIAFPTGQSYSSLPIWQSVSK
jgi:hypothetical protein